MNPETSTPFPNGRKPHDRRQSPRNAETIRELKAWRAAAAAESTSHSDDHEGCRSNVAILDALGEFLGRLEAHSARYQVQTCDSIDRAVTISITIPQTQKARKRRADAVIEMLQAWQAEDDQEQDAPLGQIERLDFRRVPEAGAES